MSSDDGDSGPGLTIVGGQPRSNRVVPGGEDLDVPVSLETLLYQAARDEEVKRRLLSDRAGTVVALGLQLRPSEQATLEAVSDEVLAGMIDHIVPDNPRGRQLMTRVAAAATSLTAGGSGGAGGAGGSGGG